MSGWWSLNRLLDSDNEQWKFREFARFYRLGEKYASWRDEFGKEKVLPYLPSEHGTGRKEPLKVYDAETGELIGHEMLALKAQKSRECAIIQLDGTRTRFLTA